MTRTTFETGTCPLSEVAIVKRFKINAYSDSPFRLTGAYSFQDFRLVPPGRVLGVTLSDIYLSNEITILKEGGPNKLYQWTCIIHKGPGMCQFFFILVVSRGEPGVPLLRVFELIAWTPVVSLGEPGVPEGLLDVLQA